MAQRWAVFLVLLLAWQGRSPSLAGEKPPLDITVKGAGGAMAFFASLPDGGFSFVVRRPNPEHAGGSGAWMVRLDGSGKTLCEKNFADKEPGPAKFASPLPDGGFVTAGWVNSADPRAASAWGMRVTSQCEALWSRTFAASEHDQAEEHDKAEEHDQAKFAAAPDGGFFVLGQNNANDAGGSNIWAMRVDGQGEATWRKSLGDRERNKERGVAPSIKALPDGGLVAVGQPDDAAHASAWAMRIDGRGNVTGDWPFGEANSAFYAEFAAAPADGGAIVATREGSLERLGNPGSTTWKVDFGWFDAGLGDVMQLADGGFVATGAGWIFHSMQNTRGRASIARVSRDGRLMWSETYGRFDLRERADPDYGPAADAEVEALTAAPDGGFVAVGSTNLRDGGETNAWVFRIDHSGAALWDKTFGNDAHKDQLTAIAAADNGFIATGKIHSADGVSRSAWVLRIDGEGRALWQAAIRDKDNDGAEVENVVKSVTGMPDGGFVIAGSSQPRTDKAGSLKTNTWVVRLDAHGAVLWKWPR